MCRSCAERGAAARWRAGKASYLPATGRCQGTRQAARQSGPIARLTAGAGACTLARVPETAASPSPAEIADRLAIQDLLTRYCRAIDGLDWELLDRCFTADAFVDYTSSGGVSGPYPEVRAWLARVLPPFAVRQHLVTNFHVELAGDRAKSRTYFYNPMGRSRPEGGVEMFFVGGFYVDELVRTAAGWRISRRLEQQAWRTP